MKTYLSDKKPLYLTNDEAAECLRLSPRTLEKLRVVGGGPPFRKFCRRVFYAVEDLQSWASARAFDTIQTFIIGPTVSDSDYEMVRVVGLEPTFRSLGGGF